MELLNQVIFFKKNIMVSKANKRAIIRKIQKKMGVTKRQNRRRHAKMGGTFGFHKNKGNNLKGGSGGLMNKIGKALRID